MAALSAEESSAASSDQEWAVERVGAAHALFTYTVDGPGGTSLHSSLWEDDGARWLLRFHQGTRTEPRA